MSKELKKLSVVFFIHFIENKCFILMGKQAPGKRLAGIRNGYGGKCEVGESTSDCAAREVSEESGMEIASSDLVKVGKIIDANMQVDFFVVISSTKFQPPADNSEFVDVRWFDLEMPELFVQEMFPNSDILIQQLTIKVNQLKMGGKITEEFTIDDTKNENVELIALKDKIHK